MMLTVSVKNSAPRQRADERAAAAGERGAAEHGRGDAGQRVGRADGRMADADLGGQEEAGERPRCSAAEDIGAHVDEIDAHAVALRRFLAEADGLQLQAAAGAVQPEVAGDGGGEDDEERHRDEADARLQEVGEVRTDRAAGRRPQMSAMPCRTLSVAIVVMTGLTPAKRTIQPLTSADGEPGGEADDDAERRASDGPISAPTMKEASTTVTLISEPTEMSKPRTISTLNCAIATSASGAVASRMWRMLSGVRKTSDCEVA